MVVLAVPLVFIVFVVLSVCVCGWVKRCVEYEVVVSRSRGRLKWTWLEVVQRDCQVRGLSKDDAMVYGRWRKMIRMVVEQEGCEWMDVSSSTGSPG